MMRRALARGDVEALVSGARAEQVLPPLYLVLPAEEDGGLDLFVTAYLVRVRQNGFMVMLPDLEAVRARLDALVNEDGESIPLQRRDQVQAETVRGRQLGPGRVILADFPWSGCEFFVKPTALRGMTDRASRVLTLSVGDVVARPSAADAQDTAGRWIDQLDPDTVQEYWASANDGGAEEEEAPDEEAPLAPPHPALLARTLPAGQSGQTRRPFSDEPGSQHCRARPLDEPSRGPSCSDRDFGATPSTAQSAFRGGPAPRGRVWGSAASRGAGLGGGVDGFYLDTANFASGTDETERGSFGEAGFRKARRRHSRGPRRRRGQRVRKLLGNQGASRPRGFCQASVGLQAGGGEGAGECHDRVGPLCHGAGHDANLHEQRVPLADHRLLQHVAALAAFGWKMGYKAESDELKGFCSRLFLLVEQAALDSRKVQLAYLLAGFPDPSPVGFAHRRASSLKTFSRLAAPQWSAANLAYLKDLDFGHGATSQCAAKGPERRAERRCREASPSAAPAPEDREFGS